MGEEQTYLQGFNQGYKLRRYSPEIFERLKDSLNAENEFDKGILEGAAQFEKEEEQQRLSELEDLSEGQGQEDLDR